MGIRHLFLMWSLCLFVILLFIHLTIGLTKSNTFAALIGISFGSVAGWLPHSKYLKR